LLGGVPSAGYLDTTYGYDSTGAHFAWYDGSAYANGQQRTTTTNHMPSSTFNGNGSSARNQTKSSTTQQMVSSEKKYSDNIVTITKLCHLCAFSSAYPYVSC